MVVSPHVRKIQIAQEDSTGVSQVLFSNVLQSTCTVITPSCSSSLLVCQMACSTLLQACIHLISTPDQSTPHLQGQLGQQGLGLEGLETKRNLIIQTYKTNYIFFLGELGLINRGRLLNPLSTL